MIPLKYGAYVTYHYKAYDGTDIFASEILELDFLPNTPTGLAKIIDIIHRKTAIGSNRITLLGMIPLSNDPKPATNDDME